MKIKKSILIIVLIAIIGIAFPSVAFAQSTNEESSINDLIDGFMGDFDTLKENLGFLGVYAGGSTQSGVFADLNSRLLNIGIMANASFLDFEGILKVAGKLGMPIPDLITEIPFPMPLVHAGLNIPFIPVRVFARGMYFPTSSFIDDADDLLLIGGGVGVDLNSFLPIPKLLTLKATANYHMFKGLPVPNFDFNSNSFGIHGFASLGIPVLKPYVGIGFNMTNTEIGFDMWPLVKGAIGDNVPDVPTEEEYKDIMDNDNIPQYIKDKIKEAYDEFNDFEKAFLLSQKITYTAIPISVGVNIDLLLLKMNVEYSHNLLNMGNLGTVSLSVGFGF